MESTRFVFFCVLCVAATVTSQEGAANVTTSTEIDAVTVTTPRPQRNCSTAHNTEGTCVQRVSCDYGTPAIDYTLYAPSWYKSSCMSDEVCCPSEYIHDPASPNTKATASIDSDDDLE